MSEQEDPREAGDAAGGRGPDRSGEPRDPDAAWAEIVANFGERVQLDDDPDDLTLPAQPAEPPTPRAEEQPRVEEPPGGWFAAEPVDLDDEGTYEPPPPPPLPSLPPDRMAAWAGVLGAPVVAVLLVLLRGLAGFTVPGWVVMVLVGAFLGGFGYLIATMPRGPADPWDDGARV